MGDSDLSPPGGDESTGTVSSRGGGISQKYLPARVSKYYLFPCTPNYEDSRGDNFLRVQLAPKGVDNQKLGEIVRGHPLYPRLSTSVYLFFITKCHNFQD